MKKILCTALIASICFATPIVAIATENEPIDSTASTYTLEKCISTALENNLTIKKIEQELKISEFNKKITTKNSKKILDSRDELDENWSKYSQNKKVGEENKKKLDTLKSALASSPDPDSILNYLKTSNQIDDTIYNSLVGKTSDEMKQTIGGMQSQIDTKLDSAYNSLLSGDSQISNANDNANNFLSDTLKSTTNVKLNLKSTTQLMSAIANINYEITKAGLDIGKKQISMLVENNYYEALKKQKLVDVKRKSLQRATGQYNIVKESYEEGLKAKDDLLLSKSQLELLKADLEKAISEAKNAKIDLLSSLNIPLDTEIEITDVNLTTKQVPSLDEGIKQGLVKRIEVKQSNSKYAIAKLNHELTSRNYPDITNQFKESLYKEELAEISYEISKKDVETDIRKSYETMIATQKMYEHVKNSVSQMKENLDIATFKYNEGIGSDSANLEIKELGGTIMEVLSAGEKLAEVEEKVVEIENAMNISITKYLNSIGEY